MRFSRLFGILGWVLAVAGIGASVLFFSMLRESRETERLTALQMYNPARSLTQLPEDWQAGKLRVLLVGDSRIRRWTELPQNADVAFAKSGVGGETTGQLERRFQRDVLDIEPLPHEIVIAAGINDLVGASVQRKRGDGFRNAVSNQMISRLEGLAEQAQAAGIKVRIATIIQSAEPDVVRRMMFWDDNLFELVSAANTAIHAMAETSEIEVIDFNAMLRGADGPLPEEFSDDTLHFSPAAYVALNAGLNESFSRK